MLVKTSEISILSIMSYLFGTIIRLVKDLVESAPKVIKEAAPKDEAESIKKKFEEVGAKVEVK